MRSFGLLSHRGSIEAAVQGSRSDHEVASDPSDYPEPVLVRFDQGFRVDRRSITVISGRDIFEHLRSSSMKTAVSTSTRLCSTIQRLKVFLPINLFRCLSTHQAKHFC